MKPASPAILLIALVATVAPAAAVEVSRIDQLPTDRPPVERPQYDYPSADEWNVPNYDIGGPNVAKSPNPFPMKCILDRQLTDGTNVTVWFKNNGDNVIPAGTWFIVTYPDGTQEKYKLPMDLKPSEAWGFWLPVGVYDFKSDFDCKATVTTA